MISYRSVSPKLLFGALCLVIGGMIIACATAPKGSVNLQSSVDPSLRANAVKSIAVFPIRNIRLSPDEQREVNKGMVIGFQTSNPRLTILGPGEAVTQLNAANLAETYSEFLRNYSQSAIPDVNALNKVGNSLHIDAILQGDTFDIVQYDGHSNLYGNTSLTVRYTLLGTKTGDILWQATARVKEMSKKPNIPAPTLYQTMQKGQEKILSQLPILAQ
jgi:hypothetical protein